jgi:hypothetical protein
MAYLNFRLVSDTLKCAAIGHKVGQKMDRDKHLSR